MCGQDRAAFDTEAAFGSAGSTPADGRGALQLELGPAHAAAGASFPHRPCRSSCSSLKNRTSFWRGNGQGVELPACVVGLGF